VHNVCDGHLGFGGIAINSVPSGNKTVSNPPWGRLFRQEKPFPGSDPLRGGSFQFTRSFRFGLRRDQADDEQEKGFHVSSSDDVFLLSYNSTK